MSVRIRMQRKGRKKRPFYRVVAADREAPRDGRFIELLGTYDPMQQPPALSLKQDRIDYWLEHGATPSDTVRHLINASRSEQGTIDAKEKPSTLRSRSEKAAEREKAAAEAAAEAAAAEKEAAEAAKAAAAEADAEAEAEEAPADDAPAETEAADEAGEEESSDE